MIAQIEVQVYRDLVSYLAGGMTLSEFRQRFDSLSWDVAEWNSSLVSQIELALAEFSSGHRTEAELRKVLQSSTHSFTLQTEPLVLAAAAGAIQTTGSINAVRTVRPVAIAKTPELFVGRLREMECA